MSSPQPRPNVSAIPAYVAGKPPTPVPGLTSYKLSSNENPHAPLPGVLEAAVGAAARMNRYPDMGNSELYASKDRHANTTSSPGSQKAWAS